MYCMVMLNSSKFLSSSTATLLVEQKISVTPSKFILCIVFIPTLFLIILLLVVVVVFVLRHNRDYQIVEICSKSSNFTKNL